MYSKVIQCVCMYIYLYTHKLFHVLFHSRLLQGTEYASLFYTVGVFCLSRTLTSNHPYLELCSHDYSSLKQCIPLYTHFRTLNLWLPISFVSYVGIPINFKEA